MDHFATEVKEDSRLQICPTYVNERLKSIKVVWLVVEMVVQEGVDASLEEDGVVDSGHADIITLVPAWLSTTCC